MANIFDRFNQGFGNFLNPNPQPANPYMDSLMLDDALKELIRQQQETQRQNMGNMFRTGLGTALLEMGAPRTTPGLDLTPLSRIIGSINQASQTGTGDVFDLPMKALQFQNIQQNVLASKPLSVSEIGELDTTNIIKNLTVDNIDEVRNQLNTAKTNATTKYYNRTAAQPYVQAINNAITQLDKLSVTKNIFDNNTKLNFAEQFKNARGTQLLAASDRFTKENFSDLLLGKDDKFITQYPGLENYIPAGVFQKVQNKLTIDDKLALSNNLRLLNEKDRIDSDIIEIIRNQPDRDINTLKKEFGYQKYIDAQDKINSIISSITATTPQPNASGETFNITGEQFDPTARVNLEPLNYNLYDPNNLSLSMTERNAQQNVTEPQVEPPAVETPEQSVDETKKPKVRTINLDNLNETNQATDKNNQEMPEYNNYSMNQLTATNYKFPKIKDTQFEKFVDNQVKIFAGDKKPEIQEQERQKISAQVRKDIENNREILKNADLILKNVETLLDPDNLKLIEAYAASGEDAELTTALKQGFGGLFSPKFANDRAKYIQIVDQIINLNFFEKIKGMKKDGGSTGMGPLTEREGARFDNSVKRLKHLLIEGTQKVAPGGYVTVDMIVESLKEIQDVMLINKAEIYTKFNDIFDISILEAN